ncbi:uncharacterized protein LOC110023542 [Phalaenopsis equestris]|uniref:uncharacterized protein LOC110023542 n=1 Tax=Phalaenopsis equestris TaxID=78828 RepID=UPI0009E4BA02|nr:uncharacterized protein LOC110023542 [Phalaenopsis equestris]
MGRCFGCCFDESEPYNGVRVMHINGHVEGFDPPITASEVTGKPPYRLLFTPIQLLAGVAKPLCGDEQLEPGRFYFLLPHSALQAGPVDLVALANGLTAKARRSANCRPDKGNRRPVLETDSEESPVGVGSKARRGKPWRPVLSTIRELSFRLTMERRESMKTPVNTIAEVMACPRNEAMNQGGD